jgi:histidyl-tRNA synthetase
MKIEIDTVKGFQDYLPPESLKREAIKKIAEKYFKLYGFLPVETPIIEFDELMRSTDLPSEGEDEAISERFRLQDRGKRNLGLRYEFTFQLSRIFKQNTNIKLPFKRFQIGENFRDEPIRAGRTRQFTQLDADIIGDSSVNADAECISLVSDILKELKIKEFEIQINNRALLTALIESVQIKNPKNIMRELDKIEKLGADQIKSNLRKYTSANQVITLLRLLEKDLAFYKKNAFPGLEELEDLIETCKQYGIKVRFNPYMIRGFGYYTGNIFEFVIPNKGTIIAGGRYDKNIGKYSGKDIPAVGISFSLEAIMGLCPDETSQIKIEQYPKALLLSISQDLETIKLAKTLRKNNISCTMSFSKPSKTLDYANSQKIPYVIFVGEEEISKKKYKLKNMIDGKESFMSEDQLTKKLAK